VAYCAVRSVTKQKTLIILTPGGNSCGRTPLYPCSRTWGCCSASGGTAEPPDLQQMVMVMVVFVMVMVMFMLMVMVVVVVVFVVIVVGVVLVVNDWQ
jgi:hypothetical protein